MSYCRFLPAVVLLLLLPLSSDAQQQQQIRTTTPGDDFDTPLAEVWDAIVVAAKLSRDAYKHDEPLPDDDNDKTTKNNLEFKGRFKSRSTSVLIAVDDNACYFAMAGLERGFQWIQDINPRSVFIEAKDNKRGRQGRCRVVKTYKQLFNQAEPYRKEIEKQLERDECQQGKPVFMTGHDRGGALATLMGIYFFESILPKSVQWIVTFGAPPVFMPTQYAGLIKSRGELRSPKPAGRTACKALNFDQYVPMYNSEAAMQQQVQGGLVYDFMFFLNFALYSLIREGPDEIALGGGLNNTTVPSCMQKAAARLADFTLTRRGSRGNVGHPWGQYVLLPPDSDNPAQTIQLLHHPQPYKKQRGFDQAVPSELTTEMLGLVSDCDDKEGSIHDIETYVDKVERISDIPEAMEGLQGCFTPCNFDYECAGSFLFRSTTADRATCTSEKQCVDPRIGCARPDDE